MDNNTKLISNEFTKSWSEVSVVVLKPVKTFQFFWYYAPLAILASKAFLSDNELVLKGKNVASSGIILSTEPFEFFLCWIWNFI